QRELGPVGPALETVVFDEAFGERDVAVCAGVADRVHVSRRVAHYRDGNAVEHDAAGGRGRELLDRTHLLCGHRAAASSLSSASSRCASSVGSAIFCTISPRKPSTTSRRASSSWIPRASR